MACWSSVTPALYFTGCRQVDSEAAQHPPLILSSGASESGSSSSSRLNTERLFSHLIEKLPSLNLRSTYLIQYGGISACLAVVNQMWVTAPRLTRWLCSTPVCPLTNPSLVVYGSSVSKSQELLVFIQSCVSPSFESSWFWAFHLPLCNKLTPWCICVMLFFPPPSLSLR